MHFCAYTVLLLSCLFAEGPQSTTTFPIPADMHETWPGAKLNDAENQLLKKAVESDLRVMEKDCDQKTPFESVNSADLNLGKLGHGILVLMTGSCVCGVTGGCPIYSYVRETGGYRKVLGGRRRDPFGWAFAVVSSNTETPDLVIAGNAGGGHIVLSLYRYDGNAFAPQACEVLTKKDPDSAASWWDSSQIVVESCAGK